MRRTISAVAGEDGVYSAVFATTGGEAGDYTVGACYPGAASSAVQDSFSIVGMKRGQALNIIWDYALGDTATRMVTIQNRSAVPLTGLAVEFSDVPEECKLSYTLAEAIPANGNVTLSLEAEAVGVTEQAEYSKFYAHIESAEGASLDFPLYFHSQTQKAYLRATPSRIDTTMAVGETRYIDVTVVNDGKGDSGAIDAVIPSVNWLKIVGGASVGNLASGESAVITLALSPTAADGLALNNPLSGGRLSVNCANGTGCLIPLKFMPVSEATGGIVVDAVDNNTYTLESSPHLSNATVRISNPYTGATVATGKTGMDGLWMADGIPEGTYQLTITAPNHETYADGITVEPGRNTRIEAFLQYQLVSVSWNVEKTEIDDSYDIELVLEYETQVPAPIVKTYMPDELPILNEGESHTFTIMLENTGSIAAERVTLVMPEIEGYEFTLSDNDVSLPAKSSVSIAAVFSRPATRTMLMATRSRVITVTKAKCIYTTKTVVVYPCGREHPEYSYPTKVRHGECTTETVQVVVDDDDDEKEEREPSRGGGGSGGVWGPGGFGGGSGSTYTKKDCDVCLADKKAALDNCRDRFNEIVDYLNAIIDKRMVSNSDCIGKAPLFTESIVLPNHDRGYGDLAADVYGNNEVDISQSGYRPMMEDEVRAIIGDSYWIFNGRIVDTSGLKAWLYVDKSTLIGASPADIFLVFAGTEHADDWMENAKNGVCAKTGQYETASSLLHSVLSGFSGQIHVIGHSLGGGLTQYAMLMNDLDGRVDGTTFNSAGLCESSIPDLNHCNAAANSIRNFRALNDPVSYIGHHLGPIYTVDGADGHFISYFGSNPPEIGYWSSIGWSLGSGAALWVDYLKDKIDDLNNYYRYGLDGGAIAAALENCLSRLLSTCDEYDSPYSIVDMFNEAALGKLKTKALEGVDSELSAQLERLQVLPLAIAGDLAIKGNLFGGTFAKNGAITKVDTWLKVKDRYSSPVEAGTKNSNRILLSESVFREASADEWLTVNPNRLCDFLEMIAAYEEISLDQVKSLKPDGVSDLAVDNFYFRMTNTTAAVRAGSFDGVDCIDLEQMHKGYRVLKAVAEYVYGLGYNEKRLDETSEAVCARITLNLSQSLSMTREAFDGTLTLYNGNTTTPLSDLRLDVSVLDEDGNECKDLFEMFANGTSGNMSEGSALAGGLAVSAGGTGSAMVRFIPKREAAPTVEKLYRFGGTVTYTDPFSGEAATVRLTPVALTVSPSPYLHLDYFVQRDVFADDPFTPDVVEASMSAELAVLVRNIGGGNANKVTIASAQPEMVENEKGLSAVFNLKDYTLEASALNGATAHLGLNTVSLGTIEPSESKVAQWWLSSTIEGHFVGMSATVTPVNSWNTPDTVLVDPNVGVHKLVRSIVADGDALPDFLVCDGSDLYGTPNEIYTAAGEQFPVYAATVATSATLSTDGEIELPISLTPARSGWNYGYAAIPGLFRYRISRIARGDGSEIPLRNAWITDRTFRDGNTPLLEDWLHIVDEFASNEAQTYTVYLVAKPTDVPEVTAFEGVTAGTVEYAARDSVTVVFSKPIDVGTFTVDDLSLVKQGTYMDDLSAITVTAADDSGMRFTIGNLTALCGEYGRYELTVQCAGIADLDGNYGRNGKSVAWTFAETGSIAPQLTGLVRRQSDGFGGMEFAVAFDRDVSAATVTSGKFSLRRNGSIVALPAEASVAVRNAAEYVLSGLDSALAEDGEYTLTFSANGVTDEVGNVASGSKSVTWTVDMTPPSQIADLAISPDGGYSDSDGITYTGALMVTGALPEADLTVEVIARYIGGGETVLATFDGEGTAATQFSQDINLPGAGNVTLVVRLTDAAGNSSDTEKSVYVDAIALTGVLTGASEDAEVVTSSATLAFSDRVMDEDVALDKFSLTRDGEVVSLDGVTLQRVGDNAPYQWELTGLEVLCAEDGNYVLRFDGSAVRKYSSGLAMSGSLVMRWRYENPDREPPMVTEVLFDGEMPHEAYTNVFSSVSVTFSEAVNVPELIENGLIEKAARIDLLDAANAVTGCVAAVRRDGVTAPYRWDGESNTLTWEIDSTAVPAGRARLMLDAGFIADLAGNRLAAARHDGDIAPYQVADGMRTYALADDMLAKVNAYAMPTWHNGELYVGEKTADNKGKIRRYVSSGAGGAQFIASGYLQSDGIDIEIPAQGCQGALVAFADMDGDGVAETYIGTAGGDVLKYPGGETIASLGTQRAVPYAYDIDGDGRDELVVGGMDGRIRIVSRDADTGTYSVALASDVNGGYLTVPNGRAAPVVADINHDGIADIVSGDTAGNIWAYLGDGNVWCAQPVTVFTNNVSLADRSRLGYGDVDSDGIEDLIVGRSDGSVMVMLGAETPSPVVPFAVKAVVAARTGAHGTIAPGGDTTYDGGETPEYVISPDVGYHIADVLVDGISIGVTNRYVFAPLATSHTISADFAVTPYAITYTGLKGADNPNPASYTVEDTVTFAAPGEAYGWVFAGWTPASIALGSTGAIEVTANWERQKFDVTVNGETRQYSYEDMAEFATNAVINCGATQYVCKGWSATNADPASGEGARAEFRVLGDVALDWQWETNVVSLAQSINAEDLEWTTGGAAEWRPEWSDAANDGLHQAYSGAIGNNTNSWIETSVEGAGTLSFVWKSSTEARYDMFQLIVDGEIKGTISGETPWTTNTVALAGGTHTIRWNYRKSRSGAAGEDMVWLDSVQWTLYVPPTLAEALNPDLFWVTDGDIEWTAVRKDTILDTHDDWATVGGLSDYESSLVETAVYGAGVLTFDWAVSCEDGYDWFDFIADGEIRESITGETGWKTVTIEFTTSGRHVLQWEYWKDDMDEAELAGDNRARLDNVRWTPVSEESQYTATTPDPIPFADIRAVYSNYWQAAEGDYEAAAHMTGRNGYAIWESYVAGLVPDDENSRFTAKIEMVDGKPVVTWEPDSEALRATRTYKIYGKKTLLDRDWTPVTDADKSEYNFFKVEVKMK